MITYTAKCLECGEQVEYQAKITHTKADIPTCPQCGGAMEKTVTQPVGGWILKGKGWFKDGY